MPIINDFIKRINFIVSSQLRHSDKKGSLDNLQSFPQDDTGEAIANYQTNANASQILLENPFS